MKKKTKSILSELNSIDIISDKNHLLENKATNIIANINNTIEYINKNYPAEDANNLIKSLQLSIKSRNPAKFQRIIRKLN